MTTNGVVEIVSRYFVSGWAATTENSSGIVVAESRGRVLGVSKADIHRLDLLEQERSLRAYMIVFEEPLNPDELSDVRVRLVEAVDPLIVATNLRLDARVACQVFVLGSPRSGTSELSASLADQLGLAWLGEGHVAPAYAAAERALDGDQNIASGIRQFRELTGQSSVVREVARRAYYLLHWSSSFVDKTPGIPMINSAPFLSKCFPEARFIFMRRNGISNILSRQKKFGGPFGDHCRDWAAAMDAWIRIRSSLPHFLEIEQEEMLARPNIVAKAVAEYVGRPDCTPGLEIALRRGTHERTGAGLGKASLADTGWDDHQKAQFRALCGETMRTWNYSLD